MRTICQLGMLVKRNAVTLWQFPFFVSISFFIFAGFKIPQFHKAFLEKIYGASLRPNIISFNNLLGACAVVGSLSEARKVLERMRQAAVAPDGFSYLWMIKAAGRQGLVH